MIATAPAGLRLVVVKITTDQDGLYGYGCGTFTQRADLVVPAVEKYLKPFLIGKPADRIDDIWQAMYNSSYWRNGPVLNNAISGVDRRCGTSRAGRPACRSTSCWAASAAKRPTATATPPAATSPQVIESAKSYMAQGFRHVRVQIGVPGMAGYGAGAADGEGRRRCTPARCSSRRPTSGARSSCWRRAARSSATKSNCCTTCTSASRPPRPCSSPRTSRSSGCSSSKTRCRRKTSPASA